MSQQGFIVCWLSESREESKRKPLTWQSDIERAIIIKAKLKIQIAILITVAIIFAVKHQNKVKEIFHQFSSTINVINHKHIHTRVGHFDKVSESRMRISSLSPRLLLWSICRNIYCHHHQAHHAQKSLSSRLSRTNQRTALIASKPVPVQARTA